MSTSDSPTTNFVDRVPDGDSLVRKVCDDCGYIEYTNPKVVVGAVVTYDDNGIEKVLLCKRAIAPRIGYWTMPAGFMELNESTAAGAARETLEEAGASVDIGDLLGIYDIPHIGQVYVVYRATLAEPVFSAGEESQDVRLGDSPDGQGGDPGACRQGQVGLSIRTVIGA